MLSTNGAMEKWKNDFSSDDNLRRICIRCFLSFPKRKTITKTLLVTTTANVSSQKLQNLLRFRKVRASEIWKIRGRSFGETRILQDLSLRLPHDTPRAAHRLHFQQRWLVSARGPQAAQSELGAVKWKRLTRKRSQATDAPHSFHSFLQRHAPPSPP